MKLSSFLAAFVICLLTQTAVASDALLDFSASMRSFTADFTQTVYDSDSVALQESSGQVALMRPGRFRWTYDQPVRQLIVADGVTLWVYDEDIQQVTMQPQATTLGSAPIGLLSGERAIESEFNIVDLGLKDDLRWFELEPLVKDTDFNAVYIALDDTGLRAMELRDNFDQATQIRFSNFKKNIDIPPAELQFVPPVGADVVGEPGVPRDVEAISPLTEDSPEDAPADQLIDTPAADNPDTGVVAEPDESPNAQISDEELIADTPAVDDGPPVAETLPVNVIDQDGEITFEETIIPVE